MNVKGLVWPGTRTSNFNAMVYIYRNILGLASTYQQPGFVVMDLPNGGRLEVFGYDSSYNTFFTNPVAGFLVDNIAFPRAEMGVQVIEFIGPTEFAEDGKYEHIFAPIRFIYELTYTPAHPLNQ